MSTGALIGAGSSAVGGGFTAAGNAQSARAAEEVRRRQIAEQTALEMEALRNSRNLIGEIDPNRDAIGAVDSANAPAQVAISKAANATAATGAMSGEANSSAASGAARQAKMRSKLKGVGAGDAKFQDKLRKLSGNKSALAQIARERAALYDAQVEKAAATGNNLRTIGQLIALGGAGGGAAVDYYGKAGGAPTPYTHDMTAGNDPSMPVQTNPSAQYA